MGLPDSIIVGPFDVSVTDNDSMLDAHTDEGQYVHAEKRVRVRVGLSDQVKQDVLMHELLHAIWDVYTLPSEREEDTITQLTPALLALCRFNPALKDILFPPRLALDPTARPG